MTNFKNKHFDSSTSGSPSDAPLRTRSPLDRRYSVSAVGVDVIASGTCTTALLQAFFSEVIQHG
jgi:hypothetical protein